MAKILMLMITFLIMYIKAAGASECSYNFPSIGTVLVQTSEPGGEWTDQRSVSALFIRNSIPVMRLNFVQYGSGAVDTSSANLSGLPSPLVFVVSTYSRADGVNAEMNIVSFVKNRLRVLIERNIETDIQDAVCINGETANEPPSLHVLTYDGNGDYCVMCWPKYYNLTSYHWTGNSFIPRVTKKGKRLNQNWKAAKEEFAIRCDIEILEHTMKLTSLNNK